MKIPKYIVKKASYRRYRALTILMIFVLSSLYMPIISGMQASQSGGQTHPVAEAGGPYQGEVNIPITLDGSGSYNQQNPVLVPVGDISNTNQNEVSAISITSNEVSCSAVANQAIAFNEFTERPNQKQTTTIDISPQDSPQVLPPTKETADEIIPVEETPINDASVPSSPEPQLTQNENPDATTNSLPAQEEPPATSGSTTQPVTEEIPEETSDTNDQLPPQEGESQSSNNGQNGIVGYMWDFGDGTFETEWSSESTTTHIYQENGQYTVTLTVKNAEGQTSSDTAVVTIGATPTGDTEPPSTVTGLTVTDAKDGKLTLSWAAATDNVGIDHYNIYRDDHLIQTTPLLTYLDTELTNDVFYTYQVSAVDTSSNEGERSDPKDGCPTGMNLLPIATITHGPYFGWIDEPVQFDGSSSYDLDGTIVSYQWSFGDGTYGSGHIVTHTYEDVDVYTATLTVTDNIGGKDDTQVTVTVVEAHKPPIADAGGPYLGYVDEPIRFNGSKSHDTDGTIVSYFWKFGDGTNSTGVRPLHNYSDNGTFIVTLTVKDNDGGIHSNATYAVIVAHNRAPNTPEITITSVEKGTYTFTFVSTDPDEDDLTYSIDWNDGKTFETPSFPSQTKITASHTWTTDGTYTVTVTANDGKVTSAVATITISVDAGTSGETLQQKDASASSVILKDLRYTLMIGVMALFGVVVVYNKKKRL